MSLEICRCCAGKMTVSSPRNPNICMSCEQLLDDDGTELDALLASATEPDWEKRATDHSKEIAASEPHETVFSSV